MLDVCLENMKWQTIYSGILSNINPQHYAEICDILRTLQERLFESCQTQFYLSREYLHEDLCKNALESRSGYFIGSYGVNSFQNHNFRGALRYVGSSAPSETICRCHAGLRSGYYGIAL